MNPGAGWDTALQQKVHVNRTQTSDTTPGNRSRTEHTLFTQNPSTDAERTVVVGGVLAAAAPRGRVASGPLCWRAPSKQARDLGQASAYGRAHTVVVSPVAARV